MGWEHNDSRAQLAANKRLVGPESGCEEQSTVWGQQLDGARIGKPAKDTYVYVITAIGNAFRHAMMMVQVPFFCSGDRCLSFRAEYSILWHRECSRV